MNHQWITWSIIGSAIAVLAVIAYVGYSGLRSPVRPFLIFRTGWATALRCFPSVPRAVLGIGLVIATGGALQLLSTAFPVFPSETFLFASIAWQGVMATAIAALAVYLHMFVIHEVLAERRFGADSHFYRGPIVNQSLRARPPPAPLLLQAAAFGFTIWLLTYALQIATNALIVLSPQYVRVIAPGYVRLMTYLGSTFASFLIITLFSLVRPALSLGSRQPLWQGVAMAFSRAPALFVMTALLLIAPAIIGWLTIFVPQQFFPGNMLARIVGTVVVLIFSVFQTLAVEASTVLFMNRAMNLSTGSEELEPAAPAQTAD